MTEPSLAAQRAVVVALRAASAVTDLCQAANILDRSQRPEIFPCIILGDGTTVDDSDDCFVQSEVTLDVHCWTRENGLSGVKELAGAVMRTLRGIDVTQDGINVSLAGMSATYLRDPDGEHSHAVVALDFLTDGDGE
jgi:hypothetical protein